MRDRKARISQIIVCTAAASAALVSACAHRHLKPQQFTASAPYSKTFTGSGDVVCWSVKRALLSQGYQLDRPGEGGVLTGSRDEQPKPKLNVTVRLQTTCADNRNGTSIVFVSAVREENELQKMKQTTSVGVGPATLTVPSGSAQVLGTVRRETIKDPEFYNQFFALVRNYSDQERLSEATQPARATGDSTQSAQPAPTSRRPSGTQQSDSQPENRPQD